MRQMLKRTDISFAKIQAAWRGRKFWDPSSRLSDGSPSVAGPTVAEFDAAYCFWHMGVSIDEILDKVAFNFLAQPCLISVYFGGSIYDDLANIIIIAVNNIIIEIGLEDAAAVMKTWSPSILTLQPL